MLIYAAVHDYVMELYFCVYEKHARYRTRYFLLVKSFLSEDWTIEPFERKNLRPKAQS